MYHVVEFEDGSLAIVLDKWYTPEKRNVNWPPLKEYHRAVRNLSSVSSDWNKFSIKRKFYETENFEIAQNKLKLAEEFSDINTGDENINTSRRQVKKPKHLVLESSDDEEPEIHERPPKCFIKKIPGNTLKSPIGELGPSCSQISSCSQSSALSYGASQKCFSQSRSRGADDIVVNNIDQSVQRKILENLVFVKQQNKEILNLLKSGLIGSGNQNQVTSSRLPELPIDLPCTTSNEVIKLEEYLSLKEHFTALNSYLISLGGKDTSSCTNRILRQMLSNSASCAFNFCGSRNKQAFSNLRLNKLIIDSVKQVIPKATEKDIEDSIKVWLKHAPERLNKKRKE